MKLILLLLIPAVAFPNPCASELDLYAIINSVRTAVRSGDKAAGQRAVHHMAKAFQSPVRSEEIWVNVLRFIVTSVPFWQDAERMDPEDVLQAYLHYFDTVDVTQSKTFACNALRDAIHYFYRFTKHSDAIQALDEYNRKFSCQHGHSMAATVGRAVELNNHVLRMYTPNSAKGAWSDDNKWHKTRNYGRTP